MSGRVRRRRHRVRATRRAGAPPARDRIASGRAAARPCGIRAGVKTLPRHRRTRRPCCRRALVRRPGRAVARTRPCRPRRSRRRMEPPDPNTTCRNRIRQQPAAPAQAVRTVAPDQRNSEIFLLRWPRIGYLLRLLESNYSAGRPPSGYATSRPSMLPRGAFRDQLPQPPPRSPCAGRTSLRPQHLSRLPALLEQLHQSGDLREVLRFWDAVRRTLPCCHPACVACGLIIAPNGPAAATNE